MLQRRKVSSYELPRVYLPLLFMRSADRHQHSGRNPRTRPCLRRDVRHGRCRSEASRTLEVKFVTTVLVRHWINAPIPSLTQNRKQNQVQTQRARAWIVRTPGRRATEFESGTLAVDGVSK